MSIDIQETNFYIKVKLIYIKVKHVKYIIRVFNTFNCKVNIFVVEVIVVRLEYSHRKMYSDIIHYNVQRNPLILQEKKSYSLQWGILLSWTILTSFNFSRKETNLFHLYILTLGIDKDFSTHTHTYIYIYGYITYAFILIMVDVNHQNTHTNTHL